MLQVNEEQIDKLTETIYLMLNGKNVNQLILPENYPDNEIKQFITYFNKLIQEYDQMAEFMYSLSRGELDYDPPKGKMKILQSFKSLHANLRHLTWKTQQIAKGDFSHKVDFMGDFSAAFNDMTRQLKESFEKIEAQNKELLEANRIIEEERGKIESLLRNILPTKIITELKENGYAKPQLYKNVSVYFSDIVGFTTLSSDIEPSILISELNELFAEFDSITNETGGERIKTIGDAYLAVWGMHNPLDNHAEKALDAALKIQSYLKARNENSSMKWQIRIGINSGDVVGGIVGTNKYIYDVFGDTVNTASRMESNSEPMRINISDSTYNLVRDKYAFTERGSLFIKGKGQMKMYFVESKIESMKFKLIEDKEIVQS